MTFTSKNNQTAHTPTHTNGHTEEYTSTWLHNDWWTRSSYFRTCLGLFLIHNSSRWLRAARAARAAFSSIPGRAVGCQRSFPSQAKNLGSNVCLKPSGLKGHCAGKWWEEQHGKIWKDIHKSHLLQLVDSGVLQAWVWFLKVLGGRRRARSCAMQQT